MKSPQLPCSQCQAHCKSVFQQLSADSLERLKDLKHMVHYKKGEVIYRQDTSCFGVYCVGSGIVKTFTSEDDGKEIILHLHGAGQLLGHASLLNGSVYFESAKAVEDSTCCFIEAKNFIELKQDHPAIGQLSLHQMAHDLEATYRRAIHLIKNNVRERLADYFYSMSRVHGTHQDGHIKLNLRLSRDEIASVIGTAHETVIRYISEFKELGLIEEEDKTFLILKAEALAAIAHQEQKI